MKFMISLFSSIAVTIFLVALQISPWLSLPIGVLVGIVQFIFLKRKIGLKTELKKTQISNDKNLPQNYTQEEQKFAQCPICFGEIPKQAKKCMHCGEWISTNNRETQTTETLGESSISIMPNQSEWIFPYLAIFSVGLGLLLFTIKALWARWEANYYWDMDGIEVFGILVLLLAVIAGIYGTIRIKKWPFALSLIVYLVNAAMMIYVYRASSTTGVNSSIYLFSIFMYILAIIINIVVISKLSLISNFAKEHINQLKNDINNNQGIPISIVSFLFGLCVYILRFINIEHHANHMLSMNEHFGKTIDQTRAMYITNFDGDFQTPNSVFYALSVCGIVFGIIKTLSRKSK